MDGSMQDYGDPSHNVVSLYGTYGNDESHPLGTNAQRALDHYNMGVNLGCQHPAALYRWQRTPA